MFQEPLTNFSAEFSPKDYNDAIKSLGISLLQEWDSEMPPHPKVHVVQLPKGTLGGGKQTDSYNITNFLKVKENSEGDMIHFVVLQGSLEDKWGILNLPCSLVGNTLMKCILLLDFYNPVYSWRRGVLMQYLPSTTSLDGDKYDMETAWIANIRKSSHASEAGSPECEFLDLYQHPPSCSAIKTRFRDYLGKVNVRLKTGEGVTDFMKLAESRRRIYRPLPLDEFGMTLPYALCLLEDSKLIEMKEDASVTEIPERGLKFLNGWTGTLHGYDPHLLPPDGCYAQARGAKCPRR
ncbi:hypothetical protein N7468_007760 [Penicillium chermesinum]|uniref:Uncharacterized protein n=1 Tax=Penicillium chermesinum TaxID=63820 RepID=A0A9W9TMG1_9EURO|nr:uncharacterized protein N7468_007760 [Penicillium chermesinum]KAJ5226535.1 hypothetical protein N7468_007760 [Penicillium chermesinum]KAJ6160291.1 hypothetical protein N7470_003687 [Penicillium chermesinum]